MLFLNLLFFLGLCGQLWRMGGDGNSFYRNPLIPILIAIIKFILLKYNLLALVYILLGWGVIQLFSYGLDAPIHNFWEWIFKKGQDGNSEIVEKFTRATVGFLWSLSGILFAVLTGHWVWFGFYSIFLTIANTIFGRIKNVEISERLVGASFSMVILI